MALEAGQVVAGRFTLRRPLGEGGMGFVWEAADGERLVALKFLKRGNADDRRRFLREMRAAAAVRHPSVVAIHEVLELAEDPKPLVMVMELLEGETLGSVLKRDGKIPLAALATLLLPVVSALGAAHLAGIVHRDLKPDNIFLTRSGVKVLDFGVAKLTATEGLAAKTEALTGTGSMIGTPYYMAPEQVESEKDLDARADIWSLGVVIYECLSGVRPTEADTVGRVLKRILMADFTPIETRCPDLPPDVTALVGRMLVGDRDKRLRDLGEVGTVLTAHAKDAVLVVPTGGLPPPARASVDALAPTVTLPAAADTHTAVAVTGGRPRPRATLAALAAAALVALGVGAWRAPWRSDAPAAAPRETAMPAPPPEAVTAPATASPAPAASEVVPVPVVPSTPAAAPPAAPAAPRCPGGEVMSRGHCCPRGQEWQGTHCERPLATTF